jgi:hypothetical protein
MMDGGSNTKDTGSKPQDKKRNSKIDGKKRKIQLFSVLGGEK